MAFAGCGANLISGPTLPHTAASSGEKQSFVFQIVSLEGPGLAEVTVNRAEASCAGYYFAANASDQMDNVEEEGIDACVRYYTIDGDASDVPISFLEEEEPTSDSCRVYSLWFEIAASEEDIELLVSVNPSICTLLDYECYNTGGEECAGGNYVTESGEGYVKILCPAGSPHWNFVPYIRYNGDIPVPDDTVLAVYTSTPISADCGDYWSETRDDQYDKVQANGVNSLVKVSNVFNGTGDIIDDPHQCPSDNCRVCAFRLLLDATGESGDNYLEVEFGPYAGSKINYTRTGSDTTVDYEDANNVSIIIPAGTNDTYTFYVHYDGDIPEPPEQALAHTSMSEYNGGGEGGGEG